MAERVRILLRKQFRGELLEAILKSANVQVFEPQTEILREGQFVKAVPLVISGVVKVYSRFNDKELLLWKKRYSNPRTCFSPLRINKM